MKYILTACVAIATGFLGAYVLVAYAPLTWFDHSQPTFGSTITTILGTDTLSASRTTINNNFSALNTGKFELSDWYATTSARQITTLAALTTVGTIAAGAWNATTIAVPYGGTGSTTLSQYQILLGNGTGNVTVPLGWGTSGQFLTSAGAGVLPLWTSGAIDTTLNYNWTGTNLFKNFNASGTVANPFIVNGVSYSFPTAVGASSTVLSTNASGALIWGIPSPNRYLYSTTTQTVDIAGADAGSTSTVLGIPSGVLMASSTVQATVNMTCSNNGGTCTVQLRNYLGQILASCAALANTNGPVTFNIQMTSLTTQNTYCYTTSDNTFGVSARTVDLSGATGFVIFHSASGASQISTLRQAYIEAQR